MPDAPAGCTVIDGRNLCQWNEALDHCASLIYGGIDDWRLPSVHELLSIVVDRNPGDGTSGALDVDAFPNPVIEPHGRFLTGTNDPTAPGQAALLVDLDQGGISSDSVESGAHVRSVRGGPEMGLKLDQRFTSGERVPESGERVVVDRMTGAMWQHNIPADAYRWAEALSHCEDLLFAGFDNWRLPNRPELASLLSYGRDGAASRFPDMAPELFWTSTSDPRNCARAWRVDFATGYITSAVTDDDANRTPVRCVRQGVLFPIALAAPPNGSGP